VEAEAGHSRIQISAAGIAIAIAGGFSQNAKNLVWQAPALRVIKLAPVALDTSPLDG
jgi:hypothetical protein